MYEYSFESRTKELALKLKNEKNIEKINIYSIELDNFLTNELKPLIEELDLLYITIGNFNYNLLDRYDVDKHVVGKYMNLYILYKTKLGILKIFQEQLIVLYQKFTKSSNQKTGREKIKKSIMEWNEKVDNFVNIYTDFLEGKPNFKEIIKNNIYLKCNYILFPYS